MSIILIVILALGLFFLLRISFKILRLIRKFSLSLILDTFILSIIRDIDGPIGFDLRYRYYYKKFGRIGKNVKIDTSVYISGCEFITIGDNVHIDKFSILVASDKKLDLSYRILKTANEVNINIEKGRLLIGSNVHICQNVMIFAYGGIKIGDYCTLSACSKLYSLSSLPYNPFDKSEIVSIMPYSGKSPSIIGKIELEENVWLGLNVIVFPGVKIKKNSFTKSNSIVLFSCEENSYLCGNPAISVKKRYNY